ncbi:hypothetical protein [Actinomyces minihominis]|uniref:hypothetical protein n=1 Tax=Actinomyces minihominis TaxID=2002838 RepID=UPI000C082CA5|nr:hypothetical protein [Actinomyces minihominis]
MYEFEPNVLLVNVSRSLRERGSAIAAAERAWLPQGDKQKGMLESADIVIAVARNQIKGVFRTLSVAPDHEWPERLAYELQPLPAYADLVGQRLSEDGPYWKQGDGSAFKALPPESLEELKSRANEDLIKVGPHQVRLLADGSLIVDLAPGYDIQVRSGSLPGPKARIQEIVEALADVGACTTYQVIAEAIGNWPQPVGRSITKNAEISPAEGARVFPAGYAHAGGWLVPADDILESQQGASRPRGDILVEEGIGTRLDDGSVFIDAGDVIADAVTLRRALNV